MVCFFRAAVYSLSLSLFFSFIFFFIHCFLQIEINQFCSSNSLEEVYITRFPELDEALEDTLQRECDKWKTGIEIINVRVTKPRIPPSIAKNFEDLEKEKTRMLVIRQQEQAEATREQIRAEKDAQIAAIEGMNSEKDVSFSFFF